MAPHKPLIDRLYEEMKGAHQGRRIARSRKRTATGSTGPRSRPAASIANGGASPSRAAPDELILDEPALAEGKEYFRLGAFSVSRTTASCSPMRSTTTAPSASRSGSRTWRPASICPTTIPGMLSEIVWTADDSGFLYGLANEQWRTDNARLHRLGTPIERAMSSCSTKPTRASASAVGETSDRASGSSSRTGDHVTSEVYLLPADDPPADADPGRAAQDRPRI